MFYSNLKLNHLKNSQLIKFTVSISLILLMICSWLFSFTHVFWETLDKYIFFSLNNLIARSSLSQVFWAISNHNYMDWIHDLVMIGFFIGYIARKDDKDKLYKFCEIFFFSLWIAITILLINRFIMTDIFHIHRKSPSIVYDNITHLSEKVSWLRVKERSHTSFPGDHGTTAVFFALVMGHLRGFKSFCLSALYSSYWILPRLIVGAHWMTDILIGSLTISMLAMSISIYTPFKTIVVGIFYRFASSFRKSKGVVNPEES